MRRSSGETNRTPKSRTGKRLLAIGIPVLAAVLLLAGALGYLCTYYPADAAAVEAFAATSTVTERTLQNGDLLFDPGDADTGLVFYPGGKVDEAAYAPLMRAFAERGILCVLCKMPFHLAVLDMHAADDAREAVSGISHWYIGGHSLGGACASIEVSEHPGVYEGLILLGAYADRDLSHASLRALSIYGSEDGILDRDKYEQSRVKLPADCTEIVLSGGCHAGFGMYGTQKGDGTPAFSSAEQIIRTADAITEWMQSGQADQKQQNR